MTAIERWVQEAVPMADDFLETAVPQRLDRAGKRRLLEDARNQLWRALPEITAALVKGACEGSVQHLKLLLELGVLEKGMLQNKGSRRKEKSVEAMLMEQWQLDKQERAELARTESMAAG